MYVAGLFGCTSVIIVSEMGVWFSHHFEAPSFLGDDAQFEDQVLSTIRDGDPDDPTRMPGPFSLADGNGILNVRTSQPHFFLRIPIRDGRSVTEPISKETCLRTQRLARNGSANLGITYSLSSMSRSSSLRQKIQKLAQSSSKRGLIKS